MITEVLEDGLLVDQRLRSWWQAESSDSPPSPHTYVQKFLMRPHVDESLFDSENIYKKAGRAPKGVVLSSKRQAGLQL